MVAMGLKYSRFHLMEVFAVNQLLVFLLLVMVTVIALLVLIACVAHRVIAVARGKATPQQAVRLKRRQ